MKSLTFTRLTFGIFAGWLLLNGSACTKSGNESTDPTVTASFDLIQQKILTPSCASSGCHASEKDASFAQHGLVLAEGFAYQNLVGVDPKNSAAKADGLKRVKAQIKKASVVNVRRERERDNECKRESKT
jgi:hypothetical protein